MCEIRYSTGPQKNGMPSGVAPRHPLFYPSKIHIRGGNADLGTVFGQRECHPRFIRKLFRTCRKIFPPAAGPKLSLSVCPFSMTLPSPRVGQLFLLYSTATVDGNYGKQNGPDLPSDNRLINLNCHKTSQTNTKHQIHQHPSRTFT